MEYQILIVDDDKDLSWIIAEMLQDYGYKVLCAADSAYGQIGNEYARSEAVRVYAESGSGAYQ